MLGKLMCFDEVSGLINKFGHISNFNLVNEIISHVNLSASYINIEKIPETGRLLVVANHPLGAADWLLLLQCLSAVRKDIKVVINKDVHSLIKNMRDLFIPVNTYAAFNDVALTQIRDFLAREEAVIIFPAGGVSVLTWKGIRDRSWKNGIVIISRENKADILPVYIGGRSSLPFLLCPSRFRRFLLVRNLLHPPKQNIKVIIGDKISYEEFLNNNDLSYFSSRLNSKVYDLEKNYTFQG